MTTNTSSGVVLKQVLSTSLYEPTPPGPGEHLLFLRWSTADPPALIELDKTWADAGPPETFGYFLFLDAQPKDAASFEAEMRKKLTELKLGEPKTSGFVWATRGAPASLQTLVRTKLNSDQPCVDGTTKLSLPPGLESLSFSDNAPILSIRTEGSISGFLITHPALTAPQSHPVGLILPMTGSFVGCIQFEGLTSRFAPPPTADSTIKNLVNVSIDPHNPLDTTRNYMRFTGKEYFLKQSADSYVITPV